MPIGYVFLRLLVCVIWCRIELWQGRLLVFLESGRHIVGVSRLLGQEHRGEKERFLMFLLWSILEWKITLRVVDLVLVEWISRLMIDLSLQLLNYSIGIYDYTIWCRLAPYWARYLMLHNSVIIVIWKLGFDDLLALLFTLCHCRISLIHCAVVAAWILSRSKWGISNTFLRYLCLCATISCFQLGIYRICREPDF